ncbi:MAG: 1-deoxy-D-xylulose-5-phosphate synthase N-terminal domain-containing protein [Paracoccaceae bacterium]
MPAPITDLTTIADRLLWLLSWMIHNANHLRPAGEGDVKVGGHQASSASMVTIMTALYCHALRAEDRVAVKPHAGPVLHALQYLAGNQSLEKLQNYRGFGGAQSYPSRTKDGDFVDFSTGSVGLGVAQTLFASIVQDYVGDGAGRMVALIGDAEMDEGNIYEALLEGWKHGVRNLWWVVDYNRQSLDAMVREGLWARFQDMFAGFGWDVVVLRHGVLQQAAFAEPGGAALRTWIEACPNAAYAALTFQGGAAWRARLMADLGDQGAVSALLDRRSDEELATLMGNLGGHDLPTLTEAFDAARLHDRPTLFLCYTNKGHGLPLAGHKDNHAGLMTPAQMAVLRDRMGIAEGQEWKKWPGADASRLVAQAAALAPGRRKLAPVVDVPAALPVVAGRDKPMSTQMGFGLILNEIARDDSDFAKAIVTTSPDVTVSTNLGPWVNRRGLFARDSVADLFRAERIPSTFNWAFSPQGQHLELGIAESNLFLMLAALGLSHSMTGRRLLPIGTVYDPFIYRGLDQLNHACYQDARFLLVATPSGVTLAPEGGAHQSIGTPLVGMAQDGLAAFEPAFVDELGVIMAWAFDYMQRDGDAPPDSLTWLRDATGGSAYLRLSTRPQEQPLRDMDAGLAEGVINGGYWLREPGPNAEVVIAYQGAVAPEAVPAVARLAGLRRDVGLLAITSADRLNAGWTAAQRAREGGVAGAKSHVERLFDVLPREAALVTVIDGHPATLAWLGAVRGHRVRSLGVEHFGQTGTITDLYRHFGIDTDGIVRAALALTPGRRG